MKDILKRLLRKVIRSVSSTGPWLALEQRLATLATRTAVRREGVRGSHILLPTVGSGNIGDQAMLEAFLQNTPGKITVILTDRSSHDVAGYARAEVVVITDLYSDLIWRRLPALRELAHLLDSHESLNVIGADIMDGAYQPREAVMRYGLLTIANRRGLSTRVLGFSWAGGADKAVVRALHATQPATRLIVRDPESLARLDVDAHDAGGRLGADMVFLLDAVEEYDTVRTWLEGRAKEGAPVVIFNASGLLESRMSLLSDYGEIIAGLRAAGAAVLLLPHVLREGDDDLAACRKLFAALPSGDDVRLVDEQLSPGQVAWLATASAAVFTGRMHLSILALAREVPTVVLSTQGKVEGMLGYFDARRFAVVPRAGVAAECLDLLLEILGDAEIGRLQAACLPDVRRLAHENFRE